MIWVMMVQTLLVPPDALASLMSFVLLILRMFFPLLHTASGYLTSLNYLFSLDLFDQFHSILFFFGVSALN